MFGAKYCGGKKEELLLSWGIDGKVCLWDARANGNINTPMAVLVSKPDYPVFSVDIAKATKGPAATAEQVTEKTTGDDNEKEGTEKTTKETTVEDWYMAVAGGRNGGFLGVPVFVYHIPIKSK